MAQAVEDEMEQLHHQLALTKVGGEGCMILFTFCKGRRGWLYPCTFMRRGRLLCDPYQLLMRGRPRSTIL